MYEKIKTTLTGYPRSYYVIGAIVFLSVFCLWYIFHGPSGADYQHTRNAVERAQKQQRESVELNRSVRHAVERGADLSHEAKGRIERSTQYNHQIEERITNSQDRLNEARSYLERNAELFRRIEEQSRERQENHQTSTDATKPIPGSGSRSDNRNIDSTMK